VVRLLVDEFGLVLTPEAPPSKPRAEKLFGELCVRCHGNDGRADTEEAKKLNPPPVSFLDAERLSRVSPVLAFHALTFGIPGTGMASFDSLPVSDRWSLAFYAVTMRHFAAAKVASECQPTMPSLAELAARSDAELEHRAWGNCSPAEAVARVRLQAFEPPKGGTFAEARRYLDQIEKATVPEDRKELAISAYLIGIEPHEPALRARDPHLAARVESAFIDLRHVVEGGRASEIAAAIERARLALDAAEARGETSTGVPFFAAFAIALREGFEISLLIAALLAFVRKTGHPEQARFIHLGWLAAIPAGLVTWFALGRALKGAERELTEGLLTLFAAAMLLFVSHFVLGRLESRKWLKFLERRTVAGTSAPSRMPLVAMAFIAAYREAVEVVLFFRALLLDLPGGGLPIAAGAGVAVVLLAIAVFVAGQLGKRLNPRPVMLVSSILLTALAISLVGQGVRALQEGGYVAASPIGVPSVPLLGVFGTAQTVTAQAIVLVLVMIPIVLERISRRAA
jgi:high-affinity iron transporter